jgi:hypothetical protein
MRFGAKDITMRITFEESLQDNESITPMQQERSLLPQKTCLGRVG